LKRWLPLIVESSGHRPALEIGCGTGEDTATLVDAGLAVTAFDGSAAFLGRCLRCSRFS